MEEKNHNQFRWMLMKVFVKLGLGNHGWKGKNKDNTYTERIPQNISKKNDKNKSNKKEGTYVYL